MDCLSTRFQNNSPFACLPMPGPQSPSPHQRSFPPPLDFSFLTPPSGSGFEFPDPLIPSLTSMLENFSIKSMDDHDQSFSSLNPLSSSPSSGESSESTFSETRKSPRTIQSLPTRKQHKFYKTELCRSWDEFGHCRYGQNCQFAHGEEELVIIERHPKYKTVACRSYATTGFCFYGTRCRFLHRSEPISIPETARVLRQWSGRLFFHRLPTLVKLSMGHSIESYAE